VRLAITLLRAASMQGDHHAEHETRERGLPCGHDTARRYIMVDPTAIETDSDPTVQRMRGVALHGGMPFDVPIISEIGPNLWQGGRV
jgi:hypothetical protein